jgi:hypothetical protein
MAVRTVSVAPEYVSFYVAGDSEADVPVEYGALGVFGTSECLVVTCQYGNDGDTTITIGPHEELPLTQMPLRFDGHLDTPDGKIVLFDTNIPDILSMDVRVTRTRVRIWSNHESQPDVVVIGLG